MSLLKRFRKILSESGCIQPGSRVLVAVSGGADSVALLVLLHRAADAFDLHLEAAHLDHALRESSRADALFVEQLCDDLGVPLVVKRDDVAEVARRRKGNLEEVARDLRREFLTATASARDCQLIALGHHADDQAETFLLRLLRGSGPSGLAAMQLLNGIIVRPLLSFHRDALRSYLQEEGVAWREDESNCDQTLTRNRVRHQLIPHLETYNPNIADQLTRLCDLLSQDEDYWRSSVASALTGCSRKHGDGYVLERLTLLEMAPALGGRIIREILRQVRGDLRGVTAIHVADIFKLIGGESPQGELDLPGAWVARRYDRLLFGKRKPSANAFYEVGLDGAGQYSLPDGRSVSLTINERIQGENSEAVEFDASTLTFPLNVRHWQSGDRIRPSGMTGTKKLQDLFVDLKLTKEERQNSLVLVHADEVLWVVGLRRAEGRWPRVGEPVLRVAIKP